MADGPNKGTEITELNVSPPVESEWQEVPTTDPSFEAYFRNRQKMFEHGRNFSLFNLQIKTGKFLLRDGNGKNKHVIWEFNNDQGYEKWWDDVRTTPEVTQKINHDLLNLLDNVYGFYPWLSQIKGFIIAGHVGFGMNPGKGEGININFNHIKSLIEAHRDNDQERISSVKTYLAAEMVHELTHEEHELRGDDGLSFGAGHEEIGPHIPQFLFDPKNNHNFNRFLKETLDALKSKRDLGKPKESSGYDWAQYTALLVVADKLAEEDLGIEEALKRDSDSSKIEGLRKVIDLTGSIPEEKRKKISAQFMEFTNKQILQRAQNIEDKLGITAKLV